MKDTHKHFIFWFYREQEKPDSVTTTVIDIIGQDKDKVLVRAKELVDTSIYKYHLLKTVVEHHNDHGGTESEK